MSWFFALVIVVLIGAVAVVLSGRAGDVAMAEEYDDRPDVRVQADGPLTAADLRGVRFTTAVRGYRASEVDALLDRLAAQLDHGAPPASPSRSPRPPIDADPPEADPPTNSSEVGSGLPDWSAPGSRRPSGDDV